MNTESEVMIIASLSVIPQMRLLDRSLSAYAAAHRLLPCGDGDGFVKGETDVRPAAGKVLFNLGPEGG